MPDFALVLGLLAAIAALATVGRRASLPDPIVFALGGLALSLAPGVPRVALPPSIVLVVFLAPLIFAAAQDTSWAEVRQDARPILLLAVGLVVATMAVVAVVAHALVPALPWAAAFTLGAVVAPPDAVAAKAIADTLHLPRRLVAILEGEGLVNDATALVAFQVASGMAIAGTAFAPAAAVLRVGYAAVAGVAIGVAVGWLGRQLLRRAGDPAVESTVTLLLPFGAFLPAEALHASGVLAVVALALYLSRFGVFAAGAASRLQGRVLWEMLNFLLTGLSFVLVGLQLPAAVGGLSDRPWGAVTAAAVCLAVIVVRPLWVFGTAWLSHSVRRVLVEDGRTRQPRTGVLTVVSWAGMRGVVSLALALSLPQATVDGRPFPGRGLIVFVTFAVVLVTLLGQGLTLPVLIRRLGVDAVAGRAEAQELAAELRMARAALHRLDAVGDLTAVPDAVERVRGLYADRIERLERRRDMLAPDGQRADAGKSHEARLHEDTRRLLGQLHEIEHAELQRIRAGTDLDTPGVRRLQSHLDAVRLQEDR
jgi:CPA1 family monovalent cation:H+ antiporter